MAAKVLVHIGYHKAASSWLQRELFTLANGFHRVPGLEILEALVRPDDHDFEPERARFLLEGVPDGLVPVISHERLSGNPHSGGHDAVRIQERLRTSFPGARYLAVFRRQPQAVLSTYKQYVRVGGPQPLGRYLFPTPRGQDRIPAFRWEYFDYARLLGSYAEWLAPTQYLFLPFESLIGDLRGRAGRISSFAGSATPPVLDTNVRNPGMTFAAASIKRVGNRIFADDRVAPGALLPIRRANRPMERASTWLAKLLGPLEHRIEARAMGMVERSADDRFAGGNRRLQELVDEDLCELGYEVIATPDL